MQLFGSTQVSLLSPESFVSAIARHEEFSPGHHGQLHHPYLPGGEVQSVSPAGLGREKISELMRGLLIYR
jgi:hypothetical protein